MFNLSTKVMLIASSCYKKIGPCKNSVGYIATFDKSLMMLNDFNIVTMSANIRFLHYGNERKNRFEAKQVLLAFPMLQNNINDQLKKFIQIVNSNKYVENRNIIRRISKVSENVPIVVAVPMYTPWINLKSCSIQEFFCWFESFLMSPQINSFVNEALAFRHFSQAEKHGITKLNLLTLQKMMLNRFTRRDIMKNIYEDPLKHSKWVNLLRIITTINELNNRKNITDFLVYDLNSNPFIKESTVIDKIYSALILHAFYPDFSKFANTLTFFKKSNKINKKLDKIVNKMKLAKAKLLELSIKSLG